MRTRILLLFTLLINITMKLSAYSFIRNSMSFSRRGFKSTVRLRHDDLRSKHMAAALDRSNRHFCYINTDYDNEKGESITESLINHIENRIVWGLEKIGCNDDDIEKKAKKSFIASELTKRLVIDVNTSNNVKLNKAFFENGNLVSKAIRAISDESLDSLFKLTQENSVNAIEYILGKYKHHLEVNRAVFVHINNHHRRLVKDGPLLWKEATNDETALETYAEAAAAMGNKKWVKDGMNWGENFAISYLRRGGARKSFLQYLEQSHNFQQMDNKTISSGVNNASDFDFEKYQKLLTRDLYTSKDSITGEEKVQRIKLLDVGSCYNPIAHSDSASAFDVTAIDLYPMHSTVLKCDFLNLKITPHGTEPVLSESINLNSNANGTDKEKVIERKLISLPEASFDVVFMSLVLSYLPTPAQRLEMIQKARLLLRTPDPNGDRPHHCGLLLIVEKESIFSRQDIDINSGVGNKSNSLKRDLKQTNEKMTNPTLISNWKEVISTSGFSLIKYRNIGTSDNRRCHTFAFGTTSSFNASKLPEFNTMSSKIDPNDKISSAQMWIKQDFASYINNDEDNETENSTIKNDISNGVFDSIQNILQSSNQSQNKRSKKVSPELSKIGMPIKRSTKDGDLNVIPVAIVGGGIGGTALALALQRRNIPSIIFEKDADFATRKQGYALTMQQGASVLKSIGLGVSMLDYGVTSRAHISFDARGHIVGAYGAGLDPTESGQNFYNTNDEANDEANDYKNDDKNDDKNDNKNDDKNNDNSDDNVEIDDDQLLNTNATKKGKHNVHIPRQLLREIIMREIDPETILWNKKLINFEDSCSQNNFVKLSFDDGTHYFASCAIAADGIYSSMRNHLLSPTTTDNNLQIASDKPLNYLGLMVLLGISPMIVKYNGHNKYESVAGELHKAQVVQTNCEGSLSTRRQMQWLDGQVRVFTMPFSKTETMWQISYPLDEKKALELTATDPSVIKAEALRQCHNWHTPLVELLSSTELTKISAHPAYDRDPLQWPLHHRRSNPFSRITLLGDAAHPMSPFKGQGANQALVDSLRLSRAIISSDISKIDRRSICVALDEYEKEMCARSNIKVLKSRTASSLLHSPNAVKSGNFTRAFVAEHH